MSVLIALVEAFLSIIVPGFFLAFALLKKTGMSLFEIIILGFIFGLIFPPTLVWLESYLIPYAHIFSFSGWLYSVNVVLLTIVGIILCFQQGALNISSMKLSKPQRVGEISKAEEDYKIRVSKLREKIRELEIDTTLVKKHEGEEADLRRKHELEMNAISSMPIEERERIRELHTAEEKKLIEEHEQEEKILIEEVKKQSSKISMNVVWAILSILIIATFITRMMSIGVAPKFFEFDTYFDMLSTENILINGSQWLYDTSAWPTVVNGTSHRIQPLVPYLEAYWYNLAATPAQHSNISTTLISLVSSYYPPIVAALLVFVVFLFLYHEYDEKVGLIGASLVAAMPVLITTFVAGEQLLEPWGIFAMFFFYATYLLAVKYMDKPYYARLAILAGIAYASTFLGAHYFTVTAGILAIYILAQGVIEILKGEDMRRFYLMNAILLIVVAIFFIPYHAYRATLSGRIPNLLGVPITISMPMYSLILVFIIELLVKQFSNKLLKYKNLVYLLDSISIIGFIAIIFSYLTNTLGKYIRAFSRYAIVSLIFTIALLIILLTPIGKPIDAYLQLSEHFTTPSIPLFATVQEFAPTGVNFNFGAAGFGVIGASIGGVAIVVWLVLALFIILIMLAIIFRSSRTSVLAAAAVIPLAVAGMLEVKYLPHFGVGYILAIGVIIGELVIYAKNNFHFSGSHEETLTGAKAIKLIYAIAAIAILLEFSSFISIFSAVGQNYTTIAKYNNSLGYDLFYNVVPNYWLNALNWTKANVGPFNPRVLSWWDYGDWINWFGNTNAVLRGDNAVAKLDYETASQYVLGPADGYNSAELANFMNNVVHAKYILMDNQLQQKWGSLDFLACVSVNETSLAYAKEQGALQGLPYILGTSKCEISHDPVYLLIPLLKPSSISSYCSFSNSTIQAVKALALIGSFLSNETYCVPTTFYTSTSPTYVYNTNGTKLNMLIVPNPQFHYGTINVSGMPFVDFMVLYTPNGPNDTITDAPTEFYNSNYYRGFFFGKLPGFSVAYPQNFTGMNYVNGTYPIVILQLDNYTGGLPPVAKKPSWVHNNSTMPG